MHVAGVRTELRTCAAVSGVGGSVYCGGKSWRAQKTRPSRNSENVNEYSEPASTPALPFGVWGAAGVPPPAAPPPVVDSITYAERGRSVGEADERVRADAAVGEDPSLRASQVQG